MGAFAKYKKTFLLSFQNGMEYRVDFMLSIVSGVFIMIVQCALWTAVFKSSPQSVINGYTYKEMITYSIFSGVVSKLVAAGFEGEIANDIKSGGLSKFLTQPQNYFLYRFFNFIGGKILQIFIVIIISAVVMVVFSTGWGITVTLGSVCCFCISILLGLMINFLIFYTASSLAFVMTEVWGAFMALSQGSYLLSGGIFPLDIFGERVYRAVQYLPFKYTVFFPVNIINGHLNGTDIWNGFLVQIIWILILLLLSKVCWSRGLKKYVAVGG